MRKAPLLLTVLLAVLLSACGAGKTPSAEFHPGDFYDRLSASHDLSSLVVLDTDAVYNYLGVAPEDYTEGVVALQTDSVRVDEIWVFKAADEAAAERILHTAEFRMEYRAQETRDYFPDQYLVVQLAECVQKGNVVALFISPESEEMAETLSKATG